MTKTPYWIEPINDIYRLWIPIKIKGLQRLIFEVRKEKSSYPTPQKVFERFHANIDSFQISANKIEDYVLEYSNIRNEKTMIFKISDTLLCFKYDSNGICIGETALACPSSIKVSEKINYLFIRKPDLRLYYSLRRVDEDTIHIGVENRNYFCSGGINACQPLPLPFDFNTNLSIELIEIQDL